MARLETWYKQDLKRPLIVHKHTDVFNQDSMGNLIGVEIYSDGEPVVLAGSISGYCLLADGTTVPAVGANRSGNKASVLIPQTAYSVPGPITITIKNVDGNNITTLCVTVGIVRQSVSGNLVNPGSIVTDWSNSINAQLQAVQTAADNVGAIVAAPFDENTVYVVGNYVTNNGNLYRITGDHAAGVTWANTQKVQCTVGSELSDLKSAYNYTAESAMPLVNEITNQITDKAIIESLNSVNVTSGKALRYVNGEYTITNTQYWSITEFSVQELSIYSVSGSRGQYIPIAVFADANGNYLGFTTLEKIPTHNYLRETIIVETPLNCSKVYVNCFNGASPSVSKITLKIKTDPYVGAINIRDILHWEIGGITNGNNTASTTRARTDRIYCFNYPIHIPRNSNVTVGVWTYGNAIGETPEWKGWVSDSTHDYTIQSGTYFRLLTYDGAMSKYGYIELYNVDFYKPTHLTLLPLKWRHGVINNTGNIYNSSSPCITDMLIPTELCDYVERVGDYSTFISYYNYENGETKFVSRVGIYGSSPIHTINKSYKFFMLHVFKDWSTVVNPADCNAVFPAYTNMSQADIQNYLMKYGAYNRTWQLNDKMMISACHQGYSENGELNHNLPGGYLRAGLRGFTHGECDVKLTSDEKLVCCHDASFEDATSGQTITIANKTLAELKNCDYYGGTIATLEEIIVECKKAGIGLFIDHMTNLVDYVIPVIRSLNAWDMCWFLLGSITAMQTIIEIYPKAHIVYLTSKINYSADVVNYLETLETEAFLDIGQYLSADLEYYKTLVASLPPNVKMLVWTIDSTSQIKEILPYICGWTSNAFSGRDILNPSFGSGIDL